MDLTDLKLAQIGIETGTLGRCFVFIDYGNVNYWYERDRNDHQGGRIPKKSKWIVSIENLAAFVSTFSTGKARFYYGLDTQKPSSIHIIRLARRDFIVVTKPIQWIKHYLRENENISEFVQVREDIDGKWIRIPKCNFDVELCLDAIRLLDSYDTFCLFSGDSDFVQLAKYLKKKGKRIIVVYGGHISRGLRDQTNILVKAQDIKAQIAVLKTPRG